MRAKIFTAIFFILTSVLSLSAIAAENENNTFNLTLINNSDETFVISGIITKPGVTIQPNKEVIAPKKTLKIKCVNEASNGVGGRVLLLDGKRRNNQLFIEVREQKHYGQPAFGLHNEHYITTVVDRPVRNKNIGGLFLTHTSAIIELHNK